MRARVRDRIRFNGRAMTKVNARSSTRAGLDLGLELAVVLDYFGFGVRARA